MTNVIPIHARRCTSCGEIGTTRTLEHSGNTVAVFGACGECIAAIDGQLAAVRPVFETMLAVGVSREHANETMSFLLNLHYPDHQ